MRSEMNEKLYHERRARKIESAISRLVNNEPYVVPKGSELNVTNVAKEARVSRAIIYNRHCSLIGVIKEISGKKYSERKIKPKESESMHQTLIRELRKEIRKLNKELNDKQECIERYKHSIEMHEAAFNHLKKKHEKAKIEIAELAKPKINRF